MTDTLSHDFPVCAPVHAMLTPSTPAFSPSDDPQQDGHLYYGRVRIATEVLEKLRFLGSSERLTRVKELHAAGTTTAAALKHIGGMTPRTTEPYVGRACVPLTLSHLCLWQCPSPTCCMAGSLPTSCALPAIQRCVVAGGVANPLFTAHTLLEAGSPNPHLPYTGRDSGRPLSSRAPPNGAGLP